MSVGNSKDNDKTAKRIRLIDVAKEANLSVQAVSHVLSGNESVRIPESTRQRVREAAARIGYQPNRLARAMKTGRSHVIALWMTLDRPTTTYFRMLQRFSEKARESGYSLMIIGLDRDLAYRGVGELPEYWPVDGVIAIDAGKAIKFFRENPQNDATPVSVLALEEYENADTIGWDVMGGAKAACQRAIAAGRSDLIHISPEWIIRDYPREQRRRGYLEAMEEAGLKPNIVTVSSESSDSAELSMTEFLSSNPVPQAVFGFVDSLAIGAARSLLAHGAKIPEDTWVFGVGDTPEGADFRIPLTTLRVPVEALVDQSWDWLMNRIQDMSLPPRQTILPMEFVERESTHSRTD